MAHVYHTESEGTDLMIEYFSLDRTTGIVRKFCRVQTLPSSGDGPGLHTITGSSGGVYEVLITLTQVVNGVVLTVLRVQEVRNTYS